AQSLNRCADRWVQAVAIGAQEHSTQVKALGAHDSLSDLQAESWVAQGLILSLAQQAELAKRANQAACIPAVDGEKYHVNPKSHQPLEGWRGNARIAEDDHRAGVSQRAFGLGPGWRRGVDVSLHNREPCPLSHDTEFWHSRAPWHAASFVSVPLVGQFFRRAVVEIGPSGAVVVARLVEPVALVGFLISPKLVVHALDFVTGPVVMPFRAGGVFRWCGLFHMRIISCFVVMPFRAGGVFR